MLARHFDRAFYFRGIDMFSITTIAGLNLLVRMVRKYDVFGMDGCLVHDESDPLVEFYDRDHEFEGNPANIVGQFISRYYLSTLMSGDQSRGLCLDGGEPKWVIDGPTMQLIRERLSSLNTSYTPSIAKAAIDGTLLDISQVWPADRVSQTSFLHVINSSKDSSERTRRLADIRVQLRRSFEQMTADSLFEWVNHSIKAHVKSTHQLLLQQLRDSAALRLYYDSDGNCDGVDYTLRQTEKSVWISVNNLSVYIKREDEGVAVDIFPKGREGEQPIASTYGFYDDAVEEA
jgi:hypothetical protein